MSRRGKAGVMPKWYKGRKQYDYLSGEEIYELDSTTRRQEGKWVHVKNFDELTERQRREQINMRKR